MKTKEKRRAKQLDSAGYLKKEIIKRLRQFYNLLGRSKKTKG